MHGLPMAEAVSVGIRATDTAAQKQRRSLGTHYKPNLYYLHKQNTTLQPQHTLRIEIHRPLRRPRLKQFYVNVCA